MSRGGQFGLRPQQSFLADTREAGVFARGTLGNRLRRVDGRVLRRELRKSSCDDRKEEVVQERIGDWFAEIALTPGESLRTRVQGGNPRARTVAQQCLLRDETTETPDAIHQPLASQARTPSVNNASRRLPVA